MDTWEIRLMGGLGSIGTSAWLMGRDNGSPIWLHVLVICVWIITAVRFAIGPLKVSNHG